MNVNISGCKKKSKKQVSDLLRIVGVYVSTHLHELKSSAIQDMLKDKYGAVKKLTSSEEK